MLHCVDTYTCLNGWWDFLPSHHDDLSTVPPAGWQEAAFLVPGIWNQCLYGVRQPGEKYFHRHDEFKNPDFDYRFSPPPEFLFDAFGYPLQWSQVKQWWVRRNLAIDSLSSDRRYFLLFEAVSPQMSLYVNGCKVCDHIFPHLPCKADVTDMLHTGNNEIAVLARDYDRDEQGRATVPTGSMIPHDLYGIWQDVWFFHRSDLHVDDVTIRTSVRQNRLDVTWKLYNQSTRLRDVTLVADVVPWSPDQPHPTHSDPANWPSQSTQREITRRKLSIAAGDYCDVQVHVDRGDLALWQPDSPVLYQVRTTLIDNETELPLETHFERFGFREVWIDGPDLILNGFPLHLFSDWGHKVAPFCFDRRWVQKWFGMIRDGNMNHSRLHTCPHPTFILDMADEQGILITDEAMHGSGNGNAVDMPVFWENAADMARRLVQRDKNHPCLVMWSAGNEMRHNPSQHDNVRKNLLPMADIYKQLDPTRCVYFDGDSSLWDETRQDIISRHYGNVCSGTGWWDKSRPLHSGEMGYYHLQGPNNTLHIKGDEVYRDFAVMDEAAGLDTAMIIEDGRAEGVCCLGPWNQSCNVNLRPEKELVHLEYDDYTTPGLKPLVVKPHASEFAFWKDERYNRLTVGGTARGECTYTGVQSDPAAWSSRAGKGYATQGSFDIQAHAFRPLAVIDTSRRTQYFRGRTFTRLLHVINDTANDIAGQLFVSVSPADHTAGSAGPAIGRQQFDISLSRGRQTVQHFSVSLPNDMEPGSYDYQIHFEVCGHVIEQWSRRIVIASSALDDRIRLPIHSRRCNRFTADSVPPVVVNPAIRAASASAAESVHQDAPRVAHSDECFSRRWRLGLGPAVQARGECTCAGAHNHRRDMVQPCWLALWGCGTLQDILTPLGIDATRLDSLDANSLDDVDVLIIEPNSPPLDESATTSLREFVATGGRLVILEQQCSLLGSVTCQELPVLTAFARSPHHPILRDITDDDLAFWGDDPYTLADGDSYVARYMFDKGTSGNLQAIVDSGVGGFGRGDLNLAALLELHEARGTVLCCQMPVIRKIHDIPAAEKLFINMLQYVAGPHGNGPNPRANPCRRSGTTALTVGGTARGRGPGQAAVQPHCCRWYCPWSGTLAGVHYHPAVWSSLAGPRHDPAVPARLSACDAQAGGVNRLCRVAGADRTKIASTVDFVRSGGQALVNDIPADALGAWSDATGVHLEPADVGCIFQAVRVTPDPVLDGISNHDTCGIEKWTYTPPGTRNYKVASLALACVDGLESLLETPTASCLAELFEYGGATEQLRAHTVTRFCYGDESPAPAVILGRITIGQGTLYINQFSPPEIRPRFRRYYQRLIANLQGFTAAGNTDLHQSGYTAFPDHFSARQDGSGNPSRLYVANVVISDDLIAATAFTPGQDLHKRILDLAEWTTIDHADGVYPADVCDTDRPIGVYFVIHSPQPRKHIQLDDDLPNPELLTFMDVQGTGCCDVYVNTSSYGRLDVTTGRATASDISLEQGYNHVLLIWHRVAAGSHLRLNWRNIMHQPETAFTFH